MECAPINPSDTYFMAGMYGGLAGEDEGAAKIQYPLAPGWEGSGTVVLNGGGLMGWRIVGKRVAVSKCQEPNKQFTIGGCFQQYMVTTALQCIPLPDEVTFEQGSMLCVNPLTVVGLVDRFKQYKGTAIIQTAAASHLGRMVVRLAQEEAIPIINIIRSDEQKQILKDLNAEYILDSRDPNFLQELGDLAKQLRANICFEAVAGTLNGQIMSKMPSGSTCILYGLLSEQPVGEIDPLILIGRNQRLEGFMLPDWLQEKYVWSLFGILKKAQRLMTDEQNHSKVNQRISLF